MGRFDFEAYDARGDLALLVEVKARRGTSTDWARVMRERLFADERVSTTPMFMLATLDGIYLWKSGAPIRDLATYEMQAGDIFKPYFERANIDPSKGMNPAVFEMVVEAWLSDRTRGIGPSTSILEEAGLTNLLRGGKVVAHDTAA